MPLFCVYILLSPSAGKTYTGQTNDLYERIRMHNAGLVRSSARYRPWELLYVEEYQTRAEAMKREGWFKSRVGRKRIKTIIQERWPSGSSVPLRGTRQIEGTKSRNP